MSQDSTIKTDADGTETLPDSDQDSRVIGHYRFLQKIGEGGMGEVWEAEQTEPVQRRVALKLIKRGMDSAQVIARFESERQALALMDHPAIAKVFDAGTTKRGRPYFVMELVHGVPITEYCDRHRMTVRQRLELFVQVCEGIQHAHQKAIIHRDVKPSNILIAEQDGVPVPKIIDFGVAKATAQRLTERTLFTELGQLIGTPEYMSPEQAELTGEDIDIRTDVYSLGMVLYELLAGALPFDPKELRQAGLAELQRKIREDEPVRPSTQITRMGDSSAIAAQARRTTPAALVRSLRGDLDWIVLKALEKDRIRRYASAHAFTQDAQRFLANETVHARPPSTYYRISKFVRRHRLGMVASAAVLLAMIAGILLATVGLARARQAEHQARLEAATARQVSDFLVGIFGVTDPSEARGNTITAREILDEGAEKIQNELEEEPEIQATMMDTIGRVYQSLGLYDEALVLLETALGTRIKTLGKEHLQVATSQNNLATLLTAKGDYQAAEPYYREALATRRQLLGDDNADVAESINNLATLVFAQGNHADAEVLFREALAMNRGLLGERSPKVAEILNNLAMTTTRQGKFEEAEPMYRETLDIHREVWGDEHPEVARSLNNLGMCLFRKGDYGPAEPLLRDALAMNRRLLGEEHPEVSTNMNNLARILLANGYEADAEKLFLRVLELDRKLLGADHPYVAGTLNYLADLLEQRGDHQEAEPLIREALRIQKLVFPEDHWQIAASESRLGNCLTELQRFEEAELLLLESYPVIRDHFSEDHQRMQEALGRVVRLYEAWGKPERASEYLDLLDTIQ